MFFRSYKGTITACFMGYITQAIMVNFPPLLFVFFGQHFGITPDQTTILIACNFVTELIVDFVISRYAEKIGYRKLLILADILAILGICFMFSLPDLLPESPFIGLMISMAFCGMGGGLMEVLISPVVEACPTKNKSGMMSLLHSFYCWGQVAVVLISTIFFLVFGIDNWQIMAFLWALIPACDLLLFIFAPIYSLTPEGTEEKKPTELVKSKMFWLLVVMMMCAGASELAMSQWASTFAEVTLGVKKWLGDLIGPCLFAVCMGLSRVFFAKMSEKINLEKGIFISSIICICSYLLAIFAPSGFEFLSLIGCAACGIGCGLMWPGTFSIASKKEPLGGVFMFGMLALAGDFGCLVGPTSAGVFKGDLKTGFLVALIFPVTLAVISFILFIRDKKKKA
ncbi:MAG: MFS transporter [Clostridia bacterium]|nr:MFS transporter [Clostridia bacterium]